MRRIVINTPYNEQEQIKSIIKNFENDLLNRNIKVIYNYANQTAIELYGYDSELKKTINDPYNFASLIDAVDKMPMGSIEKKIRDYSMRNYNSCVLPEMAWTTSEDAFEKRYGRK